MAIYMWREASVITTPGIYHSPSLGLISLSSDGTNWVTIADKNLGATTVYNYGDALNDANVGKYYQWGNNYGFPYSGTIDNTTTKVNTNTYGPNNYYSSSTFVKVTSPSPYDWSSPKNDDLRGDTTDTLIARKGPCDSGFHIPEHSELTLLISIGTSLGAWASTSGADLSSYLRMPFAGSRNRGSSDTSQAGTYGYYWSSTGSSGESYQIFMGASNLSTMTNSRAVGCSIRPFKNVAEQPTDEWTVLYQ